jgi:hypothetical protein
MSPGKRGGPGRETEATDTARSQPQSSPVEPATFSADEFEPSRRLSRTPDEEAYMRELAEWLGACRRRRGEAALRLPPLDSGRRDPLGPMGDAPRREESSR